MNIHDLKELIIGKLETALAQTGNRKENKLTADMLEFTPDPKLGHFAFPCFLFAKTLKLAPNAVAAKLADAMTPDDVIIKVEAVGPYVNFFLDATVFARAAFGDLAEKNTSTTSVMVEFSQPNTHKEFHIGHVRNACLGVSLVRIFQECGDRAIPVNYIGDTGTHVAKCLWWYMKKYHGKAPRKNKGKFLGRVYVEATKESESDSARSEISQMLQKLENHDPETEKLWRMTRQWSLDAFDEIYHELSVSFDHVYYESEMLDESKVMADEMIKKGIAKKDQGAVIVDLREYDLDVALLIKSDGTVLYGAKDIPLAFKKAQMFDFNESVYVVDSRQTFYFKQLFKVLQQCRFSCAVAAHYANKDWLRSRHILSSFLVLLLCQLLSFLVE